MQLFRIFNGYYGSASVSILVLADNKAKALKLARPLFKLNTQFGLSIDQELQTELIFKTCDQEQCSNIMEYR